MNAPHLLRQIWILRKHGNIKKKHEKVNNHIYTKARNYPEVFFSFKIYSVGP